MMLYEEVGKLLSTDTEDNVSAFMMEINTLRSERFKKNNLNNSQFIILPMEIIFANNILIWKHKELFSSSINWLVVCSVKCQQMVKNYRQMSKDIHFAVTEEERKQKVFSFKKLE